MPSSTAPVAIGGNRITDVSTIAAKSTEIPMMRAIRPAVGLPGSVASAGVGATEPGDVAFSGGANEGEVTIGSQRSQR
jgi:hypothetical protein